MNSQFGVRLRLASLQNAPLPFYPRSCGIHVVASGGKERGFQPLFAVELNWVLRGKLRVQTTDTESLLSAGDAVFYYPGDRRMRFFPEKRETVLYWVSFDGPGAEPFAASFGYGRKILHPGNCPVHLFDRIRQLICSTRPADLLRMVSLITELLCLCGEPDASVGRNARLLENALQFIQMNYNDSGLNIHRLAAELKIHRSTLDRLFRRELKQTPIQYLNRYRLHKGLTLLNDTQFAIKEIAAMTGFTRTSYFNRLFKRETHATPTEFREFGLR